MLPVVLHAVEDGYRRGWVYDWPAIQTGFIYTCEHVIIEYHFNLYITLQRIIYVQINVYICIS